MYESYFGLKRTPFRLESEPDMFFSGENQTRVLKVISSALNQRKGIITLSGLPGTGKTTVVRRAVEAYISPNTIVCRVNRASSEDILSTIKSELNHRLYPSASSNQEKEISDIITNAVKERKHILVVIDEAQQLTREQIRSLYDLVLSELSLIAYFKFLLIGHEDLGELFDLDQLGRREVSITEHCQMMPLKKEEISAYIKHRLSITGWAGNPELKDEIYDYIFRLTKGVPRRINSFCDRLLLFSYMEASKSIDIELLKNFSAELYEELENETHPDLDSHDLRQALRCEKKEFESALSGPKTTAEIKTLNPADKTANSDDSANNENIGTTKPKIKLVKSDTKDAPPSPVIKPSRSPEQEKQSELISLVSNYLENPERFKHYSDEFYQLPKDLNLLLEMATEKDPVIEKAIPSALMSLMPHEVRRMIRHFLRRILLTATEDPYRILGLNASASEKDINQHFDYLMRICRSDIGGPSEWSKNDENIIKQAYIKILGSNSQIEKAAAIPMEEAPPVPASTSKKEKTDDRNVVDNKKVPKSSSQKIEVTTTKLKTESKADANKTSAKHTKKHNKTYASTVPVTEPVEIPKLLKNKSEDKKPQHQPVTKPAPEVEPVKPKQDPLPVLMETFDESQSSLQLTKVETSSNKITPIAIGAAVILLAIGGFFLFSGGDPEPHNDAKELAIPDKKPEVPEIKLLNKDAPNNSSKSGNDKNASQEDLITKILTQTEAPKAEKTITQPKAKVEAKPVEKPKVATPVTEKPVLAKKPPAPEPKKPAEPVKTAVVEKKTPTQIPKPVEKKVSTTVTTPTVAEKKQPANSAVTSAPVAATTTDTTDSTAQTKAVKPSFVSLTDADLGRLIFYFKRSYETGDINIFGDLFTEDAITNESANRKQIVRDYSALFEVTNKRIIELNDLSWDIEGESATGIGKFLLAITENENTPTEKIQGEISIKAEKVDHKAKIKELFYRYSFAEN